MLKSTALTTLSAVVLASLLSAATASAAYESYLKVKGTKQGQIKVADSKAPNADASAIRIESYQILDTTGAPAGKRKHAPIVITKEIDAASPQLLQALHANEVLTEVLIQSRDTDPKGGPAISLQATNAHVTRILRVANDDKHPSLTKGKSYEEIAFSYEKVILTRSDKGTPEVDTWE